VTREIAAGSEVDHRARPREPIAFAVVIGFSEALLFAALAPMLPQLKHALSLSTTGAGILVAAYPAGTLLATLPSGLAVARFGARRTAAVGLWAIALGSVALGLGANAPVLLAARLIQGGGASAAWTGGLAALAAGYTSAQRAQAMGVMFSAAFVGVLVGPVLGAVALTIGRDVLFVTIGAVVAAAAWWGRTRKQDATIPQRPHEQGFRDAVRRVPMVVALLSMVTVGVISGCLGTPGPLLLAGDGISGSGIAASFVVATVPQIVLTPMIGRSIGRGRAVHFVVMALLTLALLLVLLGMLSGVTTAAVFAVTVAVHVMCFNPVTVRVSQLADRLTVGQGPAMALSNGCWGFGAAVGAVLLARVADATSTRAAFSVERDA
jgi:predicted MFS family arabinose efflux permease